MTLKALGDLHRVGCIVEGEGVLVVDQYGVPCEEQGNTSNGFRHF
jgi:hypothetical protein